MVADFGQSRSTNELGVADVPPMYLAHVPPECLFRDKVTKQADIFQVGLTLYRLANSNYIFNKQLAAWDLKGLQERIIKGTFPDRAHFLPHVPKRLRTIIRKALRPDPRTRYQTPLEMVDALGRVEELLDWECELDDWSCRWIKRGKTHDYRLELATDGKRWRTQGSTERRSDGYTQARNTWNLGPYNTYKQAMRDIADLFGEMEEDEKG